VKVSEISDANSTLNLTSVREHLTLSIIPNYAENMADAVTILNCIWDELASNPALEIEYLE
jgi:hypothetical protein